MTGRLNVLTTPITPRHKWRSSWLVNTANERWRLDFTNDQLADGRCFRTLNLVDDRTREALAIEAATSLPGFTVVRVLEAIAAVQGYPKSLVTDNGPEFVGRAVDTWAYRNHVRLDFIQPGKPTQTPSSKASTDAFATNA